MTQNFDLIIGSSLQSKNITFNKINLLILMIQVLKTFFILGLFLVPFKPMAALTWRLSVNLWARLWQLKKMCKMTKRGIFSLKRLPLVQQLQRRLRLDSRELLAGNVTRWATRNAQLKETLKSAQRLVISPQVTVIVTLFYCFND